MGLYRNLTTINSVLFTRTLGNSNSPLKYQSNRSFNIPPRAFDAFSCPGGREFDHHSLGVGNLIASLDVMLRNKSWQRRRRRQTLMNSKEKMAYLWRIGWKPKAYTSCVPYLKAFKNDLYMSGFLKMVLKNCIPDLDFTELLRHLSALKTSKK